MALSLLVPYPLKTTVLWPFIPSRNHRNEILNYSKTLIFWLLSLQSESRSLTGTKNESKKKKKRKKRKKKESQRDPSVIWREVNTYSTFEVYLPSFHTHFHDSRPYIERGKGLKVQGMYFKLEKWGEHRRIWKKKIVIFTLVNNFQLLSENVHEISCFYLS